MRWCCLVFFNFFIFSFLNYYYLIICFSSITLHSIFTPLFFGPFFHPLFLLSFFLLSLFVHLINSEMPLKENRAINENENAQEWYCLVKGSPEAIKKLLSPSKYVIRTVHISRASSIVLYFFLIRLFCTVLYCFIPKSHSQSIWLFNTSYRDQATRSA